MGRILEALAADAIAATPPVGRETPEARRVRERFDDLGEALMTRLWESDSFVDENTLSVNVGRLRRKLETAGLPDLIRTRKGEGYLVEE